MPILLLVFLPYSNAIQDRLRKVARRPSGVSSYCSLQHLNKLEKGVCFLESEHHHPKISNYAASGIGFQMYFWKCQVIQIA